MMDAPTPPDAADPEAQLAAVVAALTQEVARLQKWPPIYGDLRRLLWRSLLQGIANGLGQAIGATVVVAALVWLLGKLEIVPVLGVWIARLLEAIQQAQGGL